MSTLAERIDALRRKLAASRTLHELGEDHQAEIQAVEAELQTFTVQTEGVRRAQECLEAACQEVTKRQRRLAVLEALYCQRQRCERPTSQLSQVQVGAHVSVLVIEGAQGKMLRFSARSAFSGRVLALRPGTSP